MSRKFTGKLTTKELAEAVCYALANSEYFEGEATPADCKNDPIEFLNENNFYGAKGLTEAIGKDLSKVQWDEENFEFHKREAYCGCGKIVGFNILPNGLTYLGITAGGDWEEPLFYILYYDGEKLRGYIPTDGNFWNTDTKTAYGSEHDVVDDADEEASEKAQDENIKKRFGVNSRDELGDMDTDKILADIQARITPADGKFVKPKGLADIDAAKIDASKKKREKESTGSGYVVNPADYEKIRNIVEGNKKCQCGKCTTVDEVVGEEVPAFDPNEKKPGKKMNSVDVVMVGGQDSGTPADRLADIKAEAQTLIKELDELASMELGVPATAKALNIRDGVLRRLVQKYVMTTSLIQHLENG